jgi:hypothetical protein
LIVDPKRVSVIQCDVTGSVILSDRYRGVTVPSCEIIKLVFSSFMMSSVPHEIAAHEGAVPVPFSHTTRDYEPKPVLTSLPITH